MGHSCLDPFFMSMSDNEYLVVTILVVESVYTLLIISMNLAGKPLACKVMNIILWGTNPKALVKSSAVITMLLFLLLASQKSSDIIATLSEQPLTFEIKPVWLGEKMFRLLLKRLIALAHKQLKILYIAFEIEIGLQLLGDWGSPFLKISLVWDVFQLCGTRLQSVITLLMDDKKSAAAFGTNLKRE